MANEPAATATPSATPYARLDPVGTEPAPTPSPTPAGDAIPRSPALYVHDGGGGDGLVMTIALSILSFQVGVGAAAFALYQLRALLRRARARRGA